MSSVDNSNDPELQIGDSAERVSDSGIAGSVPGDSPNSTNQSPIIEKIEQQLKKKEEEEEEEILFDGSSHSFFVYFGQTRNKSGLILSIIVLMLQTLLYSVMLAGLGDITNLIQVEVPFGKQCERIFEAETDSGEDLLKNLVCPPRVQEWQAAGLASVLLSFFMMHDIFASIKVMFVVEGCTAKIAGLCILFEAIFATGVASTFALEAGSAYEAVVSCIGVLFIHDADEKAFEALTAINLNGRLKNKCCACFCCCKRTALWSMMSILFAMFVLVFTAAAWFFERNVNHIIDKYGEKYWEDNFYGGYDYYDTSTADYSFQDYWDWDSTYSS